MSNLANATSSSNLILDGTMDMPTGGTIAPWVNTSQQLAGSYVQYATGETGFAVEGGLKSATFNWTAGHTYTFSFDAANAGWANPNPSPADNTLGVWVLDGSTWHYLGAIDVGTSGWPMHTYSFTYKAQTSSAQVYFGPPSAGPLNAGSSVSNVYIDNVAMIDNAPPTSASLTGLPSDYEFVTNPDGTIHVTGNGVDKVLPTSVTTINFSADPNTYTIGTSGAGSNLLAGTSGVDSLLGGAGNDALYGGVGNDAIYGQDGNDYISGGDGNDTIFGGFGNDTINGGAGDDVLHGIGGNDVINGGAGNDTIGGGPGNDTLDGGAGTDTVYFEGVRTDWTFTQNPDGSIMAVNSQTGETDLIRNFELAQVGTDPAVAIQNLLGQGTSGDDILYGTPNNDTLDGGAGNDQIYGLGADDLLIGGTGNDTIDGGTGNDSILAGSGNDSVLGGDGNDTINGGAGNDVLDGGAGTDTAVLAGPRTDWTFTQNPDGSITATNGATGEVDVLKNFEQAQVGTDPSVAISNLLGQGSSGDDILYGTPNNDTLDGAAGNDQIYGLGANDSLIGGTGNDTIDGGAGNDTMLGGDGNDLIYSRAGNDSVDGGTGTDTLVLGGVRSDWTFTNNTDGSITGRSNGGQTDVFRNIENLRFDDGSIVSVPSLANGSIVTVTANGQTGDEQMQLIIKGQVVGTYNVPLTATTFTYQASGTITADDVRVAFINDAYAPPYDRNLTVDKITIDGRVYESESGSTFSTGVWHANDGIVPGYGRGDTLATNSYFQYSEATPLTITAHGQTGQEIMQLLIKGQVVATYSNVPIGGTTYVYNAMGPVSANDVRIAFINDANGPAGDNNLTVDKITIGGRVFQTEDPGVYSTGVWHPDDGIVPGYGRGETLATNGYFQYGESTISITAAGWTGQEQMQLIVKGQVVATFDNVSQAASIYTYHTTSHVTADDVRIAFTNDGATSTGADRNLTVDKVDIDGNVFQSEAANTYSTSVWLPEDGIIAGYGRGETLATNGYFQYSTSAIPAANTSTALATTLVTA